VENFDRSNIEKQNKKTIAIGYDGHYSHDIRTHENGIMAKGKVR
jgi:hypothetical protein